VTACPTTSSGGSCASGYCVNVLDFVCREESLEIGDINANDPPTEAQDREAAYSVPAPKRRD